MFSGLAGGQQVPRLGRRSQRDKELLLTWRYLKAELFRLIEQAGII